MIKDIKQFIRTFLYNKDYVFFKKEKNGLNGFFLDNDLATCIKKSNPVIFDIGANEGQSATTYLTLFSQPQIYAFEPDTEVFNILSKELNGKIKAFNQAVGAELGVLKFNKFNNSCLNSLLKIDVATENRFSQEGLKEIVEVPLTTVDVFCSQHNIQHIDLLKSDTQGYEINVLEGAKEMLLRKKIDFVVLEINFVRMYEGQANFTEIMDFMQMTGYALVGMYGIVRQGYTIAWADLLFGKKN